VLSFARAVCKLAEHRRVASTNTHRDINNINSREREEKEKKTNNKYTKTKERKMKI